MSEISRMLKKTYGLNDASINALVTTIDEYNMAFNTSLEKLTIQISFPKGFEVVPIEEAPLILKQIKHLQDLQMGIILPDSDNNDIRLQKLTIRYLLEVINTLNNKIEKLENIF